MVQWRHSATSLLLLLLLAFFERAAAEEAAEAEEPDEDGESPDSENLVYFDGLTQEQVQAALGSIFKKMDRNRDEQVNEIELLVWAMRISALAAKKNAESQWLEMGLASGELLSWKKYKDHMFGTDPVSNEEESDQISIQRLMERDQRKWSVADVDHNGLLSLSEFAAFLNPEVHEHMHNAMLAETFDDLDTNNDGYVSEAEFLGEVADAKQDGDTWMYGASESGGLDDLRKQFRELHDENHDGVLDAAEVRTWLEPSGYSPLAAQTKLVLSACDADRDGALNIGELLTQPDAFSLTMLADYGKALRYHDEL